MLVRLLEQMQVHDLPLLCPLVFNRSAGSLPFGGEVEHTHIDGLPYEQTQFPDKLECWHWKVILLLL